MPAHQGLDIVRDRLQSRLKGGVKGLTTYRREAYRTNCSTCSKKMSWLQSCSTGYTANTDDRSELVLAMFFTEVSNTMAACCRLNITGGHELHTVYTRNLDAVARTLPQNGRVVQPGATWRNHTFDDGENAR